MNKVFILILNYKRPKETIDCLNSLKSLNTKYCIPHTIVVDNGSKDDSIEQIKNGKLKMENANPKFKITLIQNKKNLGFAGGNNVGIKYALQKGADFILLLNNDTKVYPDFLIQLIKVIKKDKNTGIVGPVIEHKVKNKIFYDYGGRINFKLAKAYHINKKVYKKTKSIERDFVSGCCMLVKREVFEKIGFFDEKYFLYLEDVDFCVRVKKAGYKIYLTPTAKIFHYGGASGNDWIKIVYSLKNSILFTIKWTPFLHKPAALIYNLIFYPYLAISWNLKKLKKFVLKLK